MKETIFILTTAPVRHCCRLFSRHWGSSDVGTTKIYSLVLNLFLKHSLHNDNIDFYYLLCDPTELHAMKNINLSLLLNTDPATKNHQKEDDTIDWSAVWDAHSGVLNPRCSPENLPESKWPIRIGYGNKPNERKQGQQWVRLLNYPILWILCSTYFMVLITATKLDNYYKYDNYLTIRFHDLHDYTRQITDNQSEKKLLFCRSISIVNNNY